MQICQTDTELDGSGEKMELLYCMPTTNSFMNDRDSTSASLKPAYFAVVMISFELDDICEKTDYCIPE